MLKQEFLGSNMSLNLWSLVIFLSHIFFYCSMIFLIGSKSTAMKMSLMIAAWLLYQTSMLWYGIATGQVGFILIFIFQIIATIATIIISTERTKIENI